MFAVGKATIKNISVYIFTALSKLLGHLSETTTCKFFFRLKIGKGIYHSLGYDRVNCRNSYTIQFEKLDDNRIRVPKNWSYKGIFTISNSL